MKQAYAEALKAEAQGEVPIGAIVVSQDNVLLGAGFNQVISQHDPSAHAEIVALRAAARYCGNYRLPETTLYVTLEPCVMCAGAMVHARIGRLVFACRDLKTGAAGSVFNLLQGFPLNHAVSTEEGILKTSCTKILQDFFQIRRKRKA